MMIEITQLPFLIYKSKSLSKRKKKERKGAFGGGKKYYFDSNYNSRVKNKCIII